MAKTATKKASAAEDEDVITVEAIEILPAETETKMLALVDPFNAKLAELREQYGNIIITDKASLEKAQIGVRTMTGLRNQVEKRRLEIFRPVNKLASDVKAKVDAFVADVKAIEQPIRDAINAEELRQQELARQEHIRRVGMLTEAGWTLVGQFYVCGPHRIVFDEIDTADATQLNQWVADGNAWVEQERQRLAKEAEARRAEEAAAEARRKEQAEWEEFQRWKASQAAPAEVPADPAAEPGTTIPLFESAPAPQPVNWMQNVGGAQAAPNPVGGAQAAPENIGGAQAAPFYVPETAAPVFNPPAAPLEAPAEIPQAGTIDTEEQLAKHRSSSISWLRQQPEARLYWNMAIDNVLLRFESESHTKAEWVEIFRMMKR